MTASRTPTLTPVMYHILLSLLRSDLHGYAVILSIEQMTDGDVRLGPGTLYTTLRKLLDIGLISETGDRPAEGDDERRRYYTLNGAGRAAVLAETNRLQRLVRFAKRHAGGPA